VDSFQEQVGLLHGAGRAWRRENTGLVDVDDAEVASATAVAAALGLGKTTRPPRERAPDGEDHADGLVGLHG
jgi:hypothetical protein